MLRLKVHPESWIAGILRMFFAPMFLLAASAGASTLTARFTSATDIPVTAANYTAAGNNVNLSLEFAPPLGTDFVVVKNTGLPFITGEFTNLAHGQQVSLSYNSLIYRFAANYYGGSGNDLVLVAVRGNVAVWGNDTSTDTNPSNMASRHIPFGLRDEGVLAGQTVFSIAAGGLTSYAICSDGTIATWSGGNAPTAMEPLGVLAGKTVVSIVAGLSHHLAVCSDGTLAAWGYNAQGRLGDGTNLDRPEPVAVDRTGVLAGKSVVAAAVGDSFSIAICSDGAIATWGSNQFGTLGNGTQVSSNVPVLVNTSGVLSGKTPISVAAGFYHALVACSDGSVASWGYNYYGTLGNGTKIDSPVPVAVNTSGLLQGRNVVSVAAGTFHSLALCSDGAVASWGFGDRGQLGIGQVGYDGSLPQAVDRTGVLSGRTIVGIRARRDRSGVLCTDGTVAVWGDGEMGTLGNGRIESRSFAPTLVSEASGIRSGKARALAMGSSHNVVLVDTPSSSRLRDLRLGTGKLDPEFSPGITTYTLCVPASATSTAVTPWTEDSSASLTINGASAVSGSPSAAIPLPAGNETISIKITGEDELVTSYNIHVTRGSNQTVVFHSASATPLEVPGFDATGLTCNLTLDFDPAPGTELAVIRNTGINPIFGNFTNLPQGTEVDLTHGTRTYRFVVNYFGGTGNDLVLVWGHTEIKAWGYNTDGRLGDGTNTTRYRPVRVAETPAVVEKVLVDLASSQETVALFADGSVAQWGNEVNLPAALDLSGMSPDKRIVSVKVGLQHKLALCSDGSVWAWGINAFGAMGVPGVGDSLVPIPVSDSGHLAGRKAIAIATGLQFSMALCSDGSVAAWGNNEYGQLGDGTREHKSVPVSVVGDGALEGKVITSISAGTYHAVVRCSDGTVVCWGNANEGALGSATASSCVPVPLPNLGFLAGRSVSSVSVGHSSAVVRCSDGSIAAWGRNLEKQLGSDVGSVSYVPIEVPRPAGMDGIPVKALVAGASHMLADFSGSIVAWGSNGFGQLGRGTSTYGQLPALVEGLAASPAGAVTLLVGGDAASFAGIGVPANSRLASLVPNSGFYLSAFDPDDTTCEVVVAADSLTFTLTTENPQAVVSVNGSAVLSGTASQVLPLAPGFNPVSVVVTAEDGSSTSYQLTVLRKTNLNAPFSSAGDVPASVPFYDADGLTVNLSLAFVPSLGTELTVIENTGEGFIQGSFANLSQGQVVSLTYQGFVFDYVANYYGGSGNDLVLQWARRKVLSWGSNTQGQLGTGNTTQSNVPVDLSGMGVLAGKTVLQVSAGLQHSIALCSDGTIAAWGANSSGQLGNGGNTNSNVPVRVVATGVLAGKQVVAVSAGGNHSLALGSDGAVYAWGSNASRQLGNGSTTSSSIPVVIDTRNLPAGAMIVSVSAGMEHNMALSSQGEVFTWGASELLGRSGGSSFPDVVDRNGALYGRKVKSMEAGRFHALVICEDGGIVGWGNSAVLGVSTYPSQQDPANVAQSGALAGTHARTLAAGIYHSMVGTWEEGLATFGNNTYGELGDGTMTASPIPVEISGKGVLAGKTISSIAVGDYHNLAACDDGTLAVWGWNSSGQLGNGTTANNSLPVDVSKSGALSGCMTLSVSGGNRHSLAIAAAPANSNLSGISLSLGDLNRPFSPTVANYYAQVYPRTSSISMTATVEDSLAKVKVNGVAVDSGTASGAIPLLVGDNPIQILVTAIDATTRTYTINVIRPTDLQVTFGSEPEVAVSAPWFIATERAIQLSLNFAPVLGTNLMVVRNTGIGFIAGNFSNLAQGQAVDLPFNGKVYHFVANYYGGSGNDLVLEWANRSIASWGYNLSGQLGDGTVISKSLPVGVDRSGILSGKTVVSIASCNDGSLALCADGTLAAWGSNANGALGIGAATQSVIPVALNGMGALAGKQVVAISAGNASCLALCSDGSLVAWGSNAYGQIGDGTTITRNFPVNVIVRGALVEKSVLAIAVGDRHCLVLCSDGTMVSWGQNSVGQLGKGNTSGLVTDPPVEVVSTGVLAGKQVVAIDAGSSHNLVKCSDSTLVSWGDATSGRLGNRTSSGSYSSPVLVYTSGVLNGKSIASIEAAADSSVVLCSDGTMAAWGSGLDGQLGNGMLVSATAPVLVSSTGVLTGKTVVSAVAAHACMFAICSDGSAVAWGRNTFGQLGDGTKTRRTFPVEVNSAGELYGKKVLAISSSSLSGHSHAILAEPDSGYIRWMAGLTGLANKTELGDPDLDGIPNLVEYVIDGNPAVSSTTLLPTTTVVGDTFVFHLNRLASSAEDTTQIFQYSTDMSSWTDMRISAPITPGVVIGPADENGNQAVTIAVSKVASPKMFARLRVSRP